MFTALGTIMIPGTGSAGYRRGHEVPATVVENWELKVGEDGDVVEGPLPTERPATVHVRPAPEATRAEWEGWAIANGMSPEQAAEASQDDLEAIGGQDAAVGVEPERPADSAKKAEWVAYVTRMAGDDESTKAWAADDSTTKADLQGWAPGDTVALAATEANQA